MGLTKEQLPPHRNWKQVARQVRPGTFANNLRWLPIQEPAQGLTLRDLDLANMIKRRLPKPLNANAFLKVGVLKPGDKVGIRAYTIRIRYGSPPN